MKVFVTGAAGFLGSHICERLEAQGHTVFGVDNLIGGDKSNISFLKNFNEADQLHTKGFQYFLRI